MKKLRDLIGQQFVVGELRTLVNGVTALGIVCPPVLLTGAKGLGKTLLARTVAAELGSSYQEFNGRGDFNSLIGGLISADRGDVICIDEVHGLSAAQQELLYPAIDGGQLRRPKGFRIKGNEYISL